MADLRTFIAMCAFAYLFFGWIWIFYPFESGELPIGNALLGIAIAILAGITIIACFWDDTRWSKKTS